MGTRITNYISFQTRKVSQKFNCDCAIIQCVCDNLSFIDTKSSVERRRLHHFQDETSQVNR